MKNLMKQSLVVTVLLLSSFGLMAQDNGEAAELLQNDEMKEQIFNSIIENPELKKEMMQRLEIDGENQGCCSMMGNMKMKDGKMKGMMMNMNREDDGMCKKMCKMMMGNDKMMNMMENMKGDGMGMMQQENQSAIVAIEDEPTFLVDYVDIKNALVNDSYEQVKQASLEMKKSLGEIEIDEVLQDQLSESLGQLAGAGDIEGQRKYFAQLSKQLYQLVENNDITNKPLYLQHCDMAMDGQGASWLSYQEQVRNPFLGQRMPGCGSVQEIVGNN